MKHLPLLLLLILFLPGCFLSKSQRTTQPKDKEATVVLLHGLGRTHRSMEKMARHFKKQGYDVVNLRYPSTKKSIDYLSQTWLPQALKEEIKKPQQPVHIVAHSLGGILVRSYLQNNTIPTLGRFVMLSPPNQGCELAESLKDNPFFKLFTGPAGQQLGTGKDSVPLSLKSINAEIGIITGCRSNNILFSAIITGADDGKVSVEEAKLEEMKDFLVVPLDHTRIMQNPVVIKEAENFIREGKFSGQRY